MTLFAIAWLAGAAVGYASILRLGDLSAPQLRALDRSTTVVLLTGGMLEEHGPYLPASTDAVLSERLAQAVAQSVVAKKPRWTVSLFPLATELGEQGFRWLIVIHVHGAPLHLRAIDDAGDFFHDTYGGWMINSGTWCLSSADGATPWSRR